MVVLSTCGHASCRDCLAQWVEKVESNGCPHATCPFCRQAMTTVQVESILGRPFETRGSREQTTQQLVDDLTLQWLSSHTRQCGGCGNSIEKVNGCDKMECLCGYRFCFQCGAQGSNCSCTGSHHGFWDNIFQELSLSRGREPAPPQMNLGHYIQNTRQQIIQEKERQRVRDLRAWKRHLAEVEAAQVDQFTLSAPWLFCSKEVGLGRLERTLSMQVQGKGTCLGRTFRRERLQGEVLEAGQFVLGAPWLFYSNNQASLARLNFYHHCNGDFKKPWWVLYGEKKGWTKQTRSGQGVRQLKRKWDDKETDPSEPEAKKQKIF